MLLLKVYMDVCCLNRPFDDQSQDKVRLETEAVVSILKRCDTGKDWKLIGSVVIVLEILKTQDRVKKQKVSLLHEGAVEKVKYNEEIKSRATEFRENNVKLFDSLHLAAAGFANVDVLLTTDERFVKAASRSGTRIRVANPLTYYLEVLENEPLGS